MVDNAKDLIKQIAPKFNIILAILNIITAVGFIGAIVTAILVLIFNKAISKTIISTYYGSTDQLKQIKQKSLDTYFNTLSADQNKIADEIIEDTFSAESSDGQKIYVYGPDLILKYYGALNLVYALLFIAMAVVYIFSEFEDRKTQNFIKACAQKI